MTSKTVGLVIQVLFLVLQIESHFLVTYFQKANKNKICRKEKSQEDPIAPFSNVNK